MLSWLASLVMVNFYPISTVLRGAYYIKLLQGTWGLQNSNNVNYNLESFLGVNNLRTLTATQVHADILAHVQQDVPVLSKASNFN